MTSHSDSSDDISMPWIRHYPDSIDWAETIPSYAVPEMLERTCEKFGKKHAFDFMGRRWRWVDIGAQVDKMAKGLQEAGVTKGMRVGLCLPNCPYFLIAYYAILKPALLSSISTRFIRCGSYSSLSKTVKPR